MTSQPVSSFFSVLTAFWDLVNSRPVCSLMLSSHLFFCLLCLRPPLTVPCTVICLVKKRKLNCLCGGSVFSNVSKYNYCFSDYPFPEEATDYPHHQEMEQYIVDYAQHFKLPELIRFNTKVVSIRQIGKLKALVSTSTVHRWIMVLNTSLLIQPSSHDAIWQWAGLS